MIATMKAPAKAIAFIAALLLWLASATCPQPALAAQLEAGGTATGTVDVSAQSNSGTDYYFDGFTVRESGYEYELHRVDVYGVTSGTVSYDPKSKTLTLNNVRMSGVRLEYGAKITIRLIGNNIASGSYFINGWYNEPTTKYNVTITGQGTASGGRNGAVLIASGNLTVSGGTVSGGVYTDEGNVAVTGGAVNGKVETDNGSVAVSGGAVNGKVDADNGSVAVSGGTVNGDIETRGGNVTVSGGAVNGNVFTIEGNVKISGGAVNGKVEALGGNVTLSGGSISSKNCNSEPIQCENLTVNGGSISLSHCNSYEAAITCDSFRLSKGSVSIDDQSMRGLSTRSLLMTGGELSVTRCGDTAICAAFITITGGKVTATARNQYGYRPAAIQAGTMSNKPSHLKKIVGRIEAPGARFKVGGNVYASQAIDIDDWGIADHYGAKLVKYGGKSRTPNIAKVKFGGCAYEVQGIGSNAFNTKQGRKVKRVTLYGCREAGAYAFRGARALSEIRFIDLGVVTKHSKNGNLKSAKWPKTSTINKKAFAKCGNNGKVTVSIFAYTKTKGGGHGGYFKKGKKVFGVPEKDSSKYRSLFTSKGMPKSFKLATL